MEQIFAISRPIKNAKLKARAFVEYRRSLPAAAFQISGRCVTQFTFSPSFAMFLVGIHSEVRLPHLAAFRGRNAGRNPILSLPPS